LATALESFDFVFSGSPCAGDNKVEIDVKEIVETLQESRIGQRTYETTINGQSVALWYGSPEEDEGREGWFMTIKNRTHLAPGFKNGPDWKAVGRILEEHGFSR